MGKHKKQQINLEELKQKSSKAQDTPVQRRNYRGEIEPTSGFSSPEEEIKTLHERATAAIKDAIHSGFRIGELLTEKKAELKHGEFTPYVEANFTFSLRMAQHYMKLYQNREAIEAAMEEQQITGLREALRLNPKTGNKEETEKNETVSFFTQFYDSLLEGTQTISQQIQKLKQNPEPSSQELDDLKNQLQRLTEIVEQLRQETWCAFRKTKL